MITWLAPTELLPPHRVTHPERVERLVAAFREGGWDTARPALVGYSYGDRIQLLTGPHRHAAAAKLGLYVPVVVVPRDTVEMAYGHLGAWYSILAAGDRPVQQEIYWG